jgi:hypothetical protein
VINVSSTNIAIIGAMVLVFLLTVLVPFPGGRMTNLNWTVRTRGALGRAVPAGQLLPDRQPAYVASWIYTFGVLPLAAPPVGARLGRRAGDRWSSLLARLGLIWRSWPWDVM